MCETISGKTEPISLRSRRKNKSTQQVKLVADLDTRYSEMNTKLKGADQEQHPMSREQKSVK